MTNSGIDDYIHFISILVVILNNRVITASGLRLGKQTLVLFLEKPVIAEAKQRDSSDNRLTENQFTSISQLPPRVYREFCSQEEVSR